MLTSCNFLLDAAQVLGYMSILVPSLMNIEMRLTRTEYARLQEKGFQPTLGGTDVFPTHAKLDQPQPGITNWFTVRFLHFNEIVPRRQCRRSGQQSVMLKSVDRGSLPSVRSSLHQLARMVCDQIVGAYTSQLVWV
jgi:hypothetical protein